MDTNCTRLEEWLADQPDAFRGELPVDWAEHVAGCPSCARCWQDDRLLATAVVAWRATAPSPPATDTLVAVLLNEVAPGRATTPGTHSRRPVRSAWWPLVLASAALVVIAIGLSRSLPTEPSPVARNSTDQLALTTTVGTLLSRFEDAPHEMLTAGQQAFPAFPLIPQREFGDSTFEPTEIIDPAAPSAVLRYGEPIGQGVGQAFRFLKIAVPIPMTDAG